MGDFARELERLTDGSDDQYGDGCCDDNYDDERDDYP